MRESHYKPPSQIGIDRPPCAKCGARMWLILIEPADDPNYDARCFECLDCDHSEIVLVEIKSVARPLFPRFAA